MTEIKKIILKEVVDIINESSTEEAPADSVFGQFLWGGDDTLRRKDNIEEEDSEAEKEFYRPFDKR